jgi:3-phenylpropionate/trans-cinnamate dioxygenase ferredoxin reductase subunit
METWKYLIIGGGVASAQAAVGIRELDTEGSILIVHAEDRMPYDRPPLSKGMLLGNVDAEDAESKDPSFYPSNNVTLRHAEVVSIDRVARRIKLADGTEFGYEHLLLTTGATPRRLDIPGFDLEGVFTFRSVDDSLRVRAALENARQVVMVGAGYIGLEVGDRCLERGAHVTIIDPADYPWAKFASTVTGGHLRRYMEGRGATFLFGDEVSGIEGDDRVRQVRTKGARTIEADLVIVGVGVELNTQLAQDSGLEVDEKHGIVVDQKLRTADPNVWAAGDVAAFYDVNTEQRWHVEHYLNGKWQGKQVGRNMAGADETYDRVPYFFSDLVGTHMVLRGDPTAGRSARVFGDATTGEYIELYERPDHSLCMGLAFSAEEKNLDPIADKLEELIKARASVPNLSLEDLGLRLAE